MNKLRQYTSHCLRGRLSASGEGVEGGGKQGEIDTVKADEELVKRAQSGEYSAFDELVTLHRGRVYSMIVNMVKNEADAWDLTQDSFVKAWKALAKFENRSKFSTWMFRICHNVVYDWKRKKKIESDRELDDHLLNTDRIDPRARTAPKMPAAPDQAMQNAELRAQIEAALGMLSDPHREIILLREVQGLDYKEIAEILDISIGTVMSRLFNARKKLQNLLRQ